MCSVLLSLLTGGLVGVSHRQPLKVASPAKIVVSVNTLRLRLARSDIWRAILPFFYRESNRKRAAIGE